MPSTPPSAASLSSTTGVTGPSQLLAAALVREPGRPLVTYYDNTSGERTELSLATFENWVAKTSNLIVDGLALGPGARIALLLPLHWQTAVWLAACWNVGAVACFDADPGRGAAAADLAVSDPLHLDAALAADEVVALSLRPWGAPFAEPLPAGVLDYASEVAGYGDRFGAGSGGATAVTELDGVVLTAGSLLDAATTAADTWSLGAGGRLLTTLSPTTMNGLLAMLPCALAVDGSVVMARHYDDDVATRLAGERVTATAR